MYFIIYVTSFLRRVFPGLARLGTRGCLTISAFFWVVSFRAILFGVVLGLKMLDTLLSSFKFFEMFPSLNLDFFCMVISII